MYMFTGTSFAASLAVAQVWKSPPPPLVLVLLLDWPRLKPPVPLPVVVLFSSAAEQAGASASSSVAAAAVPQIQPRRLPELLLRVFAIVSPPRTGQAIKELRC
jgi:hypothetical protein